MFINKITNVKGMSSYFIEFKNTVMQEQKGEHGLSHLVEHCMCEKIKELDKKFNELGISWNACTSGSVVFFYMSGLSNNVKKFIEEFTNKILNYQITKDVFEREKEIVISEYLMYYNQDSNRFYYNWLRKHYNYLAELGSLEDLKNITYENFINFKNRVFNNPTNIIYVHPKSIKNFELNNITYNTKTIKIVNNVYSDNYIEYPQEYYSSGISKERTVFCGINFSITDENYLNIIALNSLFSVYMTHGLSSYLYQEIREKYGCTYHIGKLVLMSQDKKQVFVGFTCETEDKKVEILNKSIHKAMKKLLKNFSTRKFNSIYKTIITKYKMDKNLNYEDYSYFCDEDIQKTIEILMNKKITYEDMINYMKKFQNEYVIYNDLNYIPEEINKNI